MPCHFHNLCFQKVASVCMIGEVVLAIVFAFVQWYPKNSPAPQKIFQLCLSEVDFFIASGMIVKSLSPNRIIEYSNSFLVNSKVKGFFT